MPTTDRKENNFYNVCSQCATSCCISARPPLTQRRIEIIQTHLQKQKIPIKNPFAKAHYAYPKEDREKYCIFNDRKTGKCQIHAVKPETCVAGPITFDINTQTQKIEWHLKKESICPLAGKLQGDKARLGEHLTLAKNEINRLVKGLDAEALRAILKIEEPDTFKIAEDNAENLVLSKLK